jgi:hypothetical protein
MDNLQVFIRFQEENHAIKITGKKGSSCLVVPHIGMNDSILMTFLYNLMHIKKNGLVIGELAFTASPRYGL